MVTQVLFNGGHPVQLSDHPGPVELDQWSNQRREPHQFIACPLEQSNHRAPGTMTAQSCEGEVLVDAPVSPEFVDERDLRLAGADRLQPGQGLLGQRPLDAVDDPAVVIWESLAGDS